MTTLDYLITNAQVYDGLSVEAQFVDVGIAGDRIVYLGEEAAVAARETIDADGQLLCPGFIDTHASTGLGYMLPHAADNKLFQGVTTEIIGNCGTSSGPVLPLLEPTMQQLAQEIGFEFTWRGLGEWFDQVERYGLQFNVASFVGHATLRAGLCTDQQQITAVEIEQMKRALDGACREGALGVSTGLVYAPGSFASTEEIIELAKVAARHSGVYVSHIRDERQNLEESIEETLRIGREARVPILVSHLKSAEKPNWGKIPTVIRRLEEARAMGLAINFEVYPYAAVSTKLRTFVPKECLADGLPGLKLRLERSDWRAYCIQWLEFRGTDFDAMMLITDSLPGHQTRGRSIADVAAEAGRTPGDTVVDLLLADPDAWIVYHCLSEDDVDAAVLHNESIICSDSWSHPVNAPHQIGEPHPRTYGAFTRFLERYAIEGLMPFGQAIKKITSYPADMLGLPDHGRVAVGAFADLVLLNPSEVKEMATFENPRQMSRGTEKVWVSGTLVLEDGQIHQDRTPGRVLRRRSAYSTRPAR
ncbi:MAG: D-aminoacylase [Acidobacteriota bacterium]